MLKKWQEILEKRKEALKQREQMKKAEQYYKIVKAGATFIQFVQQDMKKNGDKMNRATRRRMEHELNEKGVLSPELVDYYQQKIDWILMSINQKLNPPKPQNKDGVQVRNTPPPGAKVNEVGKQEPKSA